MYSPAAMREAPAASPARPGENTTDAVAGASGDAGDQREVRDQAVQGPEHRRPEPAAGDVGVLMTDA